MMAYPGHAITSVPPSVAHPGAVQVVRPSLASQPPPAVRKHRHDDEEQGKLFVGGLSWDTTQETLLRYFSRFGDVIDCVVMKNLETGRSRGFGFVTYSDPNNIDRVLASCPHSLDGRTIDPKACNPRSMQKPKRNTYLPKVFLGGLPSSITETDLRNFFTRYGEVCEVVIMYDQEKKKSRGFGFLSFADDSACSRAVSEHFVNIQNKQVEIKRAEPRTNQMSNGDSGDVKIESIDGQEWAILSPSTITNGHPPSTMVQTTAVTLAPQAYAGWSTPSPAVAPQQVVQPTIYTSPYGQMPTAIPAQPTQWGQPPPALPPPVAQQPVPTQWASHTPVPTGPPPVVPTHAYASPPPMTSHVQQPTQYITPTVYAPPSTPQPHTLWATPPGPTPPPSANGLPQIAHGDPYTAHHPLPATSPHQVTKLAGYAYAPPPMHAGMAPTLTYTYQAPPPANQPQVNKMPIQGQIIYQNPGEYFPQPVTQSPSGVSPYSQSADLTGGLGPQRGAMYTQPSQVQSYHPYRRT